MSTEFLSYFLYGVLVFGFVLLCVQLVLLQRIGRQDGLLALRFGALEHAQERTERELREELARGRQEAAGSARDDR